MSSTVADPLIGAELDGRYRVVERLADGGMATVYLAIDTRLDREVALKVMRADLAQDDAFVTRFHREARSAARLSHPHVVGVYDQGEDHGLMFLAMEYVPGQTLRQVLDAEGALTPRAATDVMLPVLEALGAAHRAGLIHRDVKPENVIIREDGVVKVADFGLARAVNTKTSTSSGVILGTAAYLSPEQVERGIADPRSDVYAAGLLLFEMLVGRKAVDGEHPVHVAYQHVHASVPAPSTVVPGLPAALDDVVLAATAKDPDDRPVDAQAMEVMLREARRRLTPAELDLRPVGAAAVAAAAVPTTVAAGATSVIPVDRPAEPPVADGTAAYGVPQPATHRRQRRTWPWLLVVLAAVVFGSTVWLFSAGPLASTTVPGVAGSSVTAAQADLKAAELAGTVVQQFDETVKKGTVIGTDPPAGDRVRRGRTIDLLVSKGPERYAVPQVVGKAQGDAENLLKQSNLTLGEVNQAYSETVTNGLVVSSDPKAGTLLKREAAVGLVVSKGRQPIKVTDYTGKPADEAVAALQKAGLKVDASTQDFSDTVPKGSVISQNPASGTLFKGDPVTLKVSKGPNLITVPHVTGLQVRDARKALTDAGFTKIKVDKAFGGFFGTVRSSNPPEGTQVSPDTEITLLVV